MSGKPLFFHQDPWALGPRTDTIGYMIETSAAGPHINAYAVRA
jgi:hypothetical protein